MILSGILIDKKLNEVKEILKRQKDLNNSVAEYIKDSIAESTRNFKDSIEQAKIDSLRHRTDSIYIAAEKMSSNMTESMENFNILKQKTNELQHPLEPIIIRISEKIWIEENDDKYQNYLSILRFADSLTEINSGSVQISGINDTPYIVKYLPKIHSTNYMTKIDTFILQNFMSKMHLTFTEKNFNHDTIFEEDEKLRMELYPYTFNNLTYCISMNKCHPWITLTYDIKPLISNQAGSYSLHSFYNGTMLIEYLGKNGYSLPTAKLNKTVSFSLLQVGGETKFNLNTRTCPWICIQQRSTSQQSINSSWKKIKMPINLNSILVKN